VLFRSYDTREFPLRTGGNVYYRGARPYCKEANPLLLPDLDPKAEIVEEGDRISLHITVGSNLKQAATARVTTELLGNAKIPNLPYENADGSPLVVDTDYFGAKRSTSAPTPGPFENPSTGDIKLKVW